ncbi:MAG: GntR family transcriptional regulator [Anaerolineae bacterium]
MRLSLDHQSRVPIYLQIVQAVKQLVVAGAINPGEQLPTVREVATELRINFNTVARAYRLLHEEGIISTQQGRGTYVLEAPAPGRHSREQLLAELAAGWLDEALRLGYEPSEVIEAMQRTIAVSSDGAAVSEGESGDGQEED